jgi:hypothetical protein
MMVPGSNLLGMALSVIQPQTIGHHAWAGRTIDDAGEYVTTYADPVDIEGSMQAVNKKLYQTLGLNLAKNYAQLYTSANVRPTSRDRSGDMLEYAGRWWLAESDMNWSAQDGWRKLLCVEVPAL